MIMQLTLWTTLPTSPRSIPAFPLYGTHMICQHFSGSYIVFPITGTKKDHV